MKTKSKSKPSAPKPADNQLTLDYLLERLIKLADIVELQVDRVNGRLDILTNAIAQDKAPAEPKRPTLKWTEHEPATIYWLITVDPATLILQPGTTLRYNVGERNISTYDGVIIGGLNACTHTMLKVSVNSGAKLHVYLTTSRKLGIKLGRPA